MSKKNSNSIKANNNIEVVTVGGKSTLSKPALITIIIAAVLALALLVWAVVMAIRSYREDEVIPPLDYMADDLSQYVDLSAANYKGYTININVPMVKDIDVDNQIIQILKAHRGELLYGGSYTMNVPSQAGDEVEIWYRGYTVDENGFQHEVSGSSNFDDTTPTRLTLGSGSMVLGFELGLIGKSAADCSKFSPYYIGSPVDGDVVYMTASYVEEVGSVIHTNELIRVDLSDPNVENQWGKGIREYIIGRDANYELGIDEIKPMVMGITNDDAMECILPDGNSITYTSAKVEFVTRGENRPITIQAVFPYNYSEESLRNKTVNFDVHIVRTANYKTAILNEQFVVEKLEMSMEELNKYAADTVEGKYREYIREQLTEQREEEIRLAAEEAMWEHLKKNVPITVLPEHEVQRVFDDYYSAYEMQYASSGSSSYYGSLDGYIRAIYGLEEEGMDWRPYLTEQVNSEITEKLIFYAIMRHENLTPTEEQYQVLYREALVEAFEYDEEKTRDDFETEEAYQAALSSYEATVVQAYGEYFKDTIYYNYASEKMLQFATVVNAGA